MLYMMSIVSTSQAASLWTHAYSTYIRKFVYLGHSQDELDQTDLHERTDEVVWVLNDERDYNAPYIYQNNI